MPLSDKILQEAITFDDVLLVPQASNVTPNQVSLKTRLSKNIELHLPIISAAMDTVTESELAKALAREGGIGIIHKNMTIERQAQEVDKVKRSENGMINNPITLRPNALLKDALDLMNEYRISGLPVVDDTKKLLGIITNRDLRYQKDLDLKVGDVMTKDNLVTSNKSVSMEKAKEVLSANRIEKLPIVNEKFELEGLITIKDIDNLEHHPNACKDDMGRLRVGAAIGVGVDMMERVEALIQAGVDLLSLDSAHGHSQNIVEAIREIRTAYPDIDLVGGNIVTPEAAEDLIAAGANILKVGIGPGSICTTRVIAGVGVPQLSAVYDVNEVAKKHNVAVIADGGIKLSGDIVKAIAAGASCVMLGGLLAGTDESPGEEIIYNGRKFKTYEGMGSLSAMKRGGKDRYFQSEKKEAKKFVPEGIEARVPYKGSIAEVVYQLGGGLRSGMGYCGAGTIDDLRENGKFVKITNNGLSESHPHDVNITKEAPNYQR